MKGNNRLEYTLVVLFESSNKQEPGNFRILKRICYEQRSEMLNLPLELNLKVVIIIISKSYALLDNELLQQSKTRKSNTASSFCEQQTTQTKQQRLDSSHQKKFVLVRDTSGLLYQQCNKCAIILTKI